MRQLLCVIPVPIVRWVLVGIASGLSGYFLCANVYPILASVSSHVVSHHYLVLNTFSEQADAKLVRVFIVPIAVFHLAIALVFKIMFFSYYVVKEIGVADPIPDPIPDRFL